MRATRVTLIAALIVGVTCACLPNLQAEDAKDSKSTSKRERRDDRRGPSSEERQERLNKMAEELKLNADQKTKVEAAFKEQGEKMRGLRDLSEDERRQKFTSMREEMNKKMKDILTKEQFEKWEKLRQERGPGGFGGPRGERRGARKGGNDSK